MGASRADPGAVPVPDCRRTPGTGAAAAVAAAAVDPAAGWRDCRAVPAEVPKMRSNVETHC